MKKERKLSSARSEGSERERLAQLLRMSETWQLQMLRARHCTASISHLAQRIER